MAFGICFGIVLLCSVLAEHVSCAWGSHANALDAPRENAYNHVGSSQVGGGQRQPGGSYPQNQFRPASSMSGSALRAGAHKGNVPNAYDITHSNRVSTQPATRAQLEPRAQGSSVYRPTSAANPIASFSLAQANGQKAPSQNIHFSLSSSIASGSSISDHQQHSRPSEAHRQSGYGRAVKSVSNMKKHSQLTQMNAYPSVQDQSSNSGSVQNPSRGRYSFRPTPQNSVAQRSATPTLTHYNQGSVKMFRVQPPVGAAAFFSSMKPSIQVSTSNNYGSTQIDMNSFTSIQTNKDAQNIGNPSRQGQGSVQTEDATTLTPFFYGGYSQLKASPRAYGSTQSGSTMGYKHPQNVQPSQIHHVSPSRVGLTSSKYFQASARRMAGTSTSSNTSITSLSSSSSRFSLGSAQGVNAQESYKPNYIPGVVKPSQPRYVATQRGSVSTYSWGPSSATPAQSPSRQVSAQKGSYTPRTGKAVISHVSAEGPSTSRNTVQLGTNLFTPNSHGPSQTSSGTTTRKRFAPTTTYIIPAAYGQGAIRHLKRHSRRGSSASTPTQYKPSSSSVSKPRPNYTASSQQRRSTSMYAQSPSQKQMGV